MKRICARFQHICCSLVLLGLVLLMHATAQTKDTAPNPNQLVHITLLQVNDVYQFAPVDHGARGGLGRLLTLRKEIAAESPNTLFLLAGDTISPSIESNIYKGAQMIEAWNAIGLDYATFGNHEFDFGPDVLRQRISESKFKWVAANVVDARTGKTFNDTAPFVIRDIGGVKIGIIGLVLPATKYTSNGGDTIDFLDPCATANRYIPEIKARGAGVIVALTHLSLGEDKELAKCAPAINLIIGGHEHTLLESFAGDAPIFKMTSDARELGRFDLYINAQTNRLDNMDWKVIPVTSATKEDPAFLAFEDKYKDLLKDLAQIIGRTAVPLDARSAANRQHETNIGSFIADAFRRALNADAAIVNGGSIRADELFKVGELSKRDVLSILPFQDPVIKIEVSGAVLRAALENGVSRSAEEPQPGRFPQVSGIRFSYDLSRPSGSRIISVEINNQPLDDQKTYTLATTTFLANGGDGYKMLAGAKTLTPPAQSPKAPDILLKAISSVPAIAPQAEGRSRKSRDN